MLIEPLNRFKFSVTAGVISLRDLQTFFLWLGTYSWSLSFLQEVSSCPPFSGRLLTDKLLHLARCYPAAELIYSPDSQQHLPKDLLTFAICCEWAMLRTGGTVSVSLMLEFFTLFLCFLSLWLDRGRRGDTFMDNETLDRGFICFPS